MMVHVYKQSMKTVSKKKKSMWSSQCGRIPPMLDPGSPGFWPSTVSRCLPISSNLSQNLSQAWGPWATSLGARVFTLSHSYSWFLKHWHAVPTGPSVRHSRPWDSVPTHAFNLQDQTALYTVLGNCSFFKTGIPLWRQSISPELNTLQYRHLL